MQALALIRIPILTVHCKGSKTHSPTVSQHTDLALGKSPPVPGPSTLISDHNRLGYISVLSISNSRLNRGLRAGRTSQRCFPLATAPN